MYKFKNCLERQNVRTTFVFSSVVQLCTLTPCSLFAQESKSLSQTLPQDESKYKHPAPHQRAWELASKPIEAKSMQEDIFHSL